MVHQLFIARLWRVYINRTGKGQSHWLMALIDILHITCYEENISGQSLVNKLLTKLSDLCGVYNLYVPQSHVLSRLWRNRVRRNSSPAYVDTYTFALLKDIVAFRHLIRASHVSLHTPPHPTTPRPHTYKGEPFFPSARKLGWIITVSYVRSSDPIFVA